MFAAKLHHMLQSVEQMKEDDLCKFYGWVDQYHQAFKHADQIVPPREIISCHLGGINELKTYLINLKPFYIRSAGDYNVFKKLLSGSNVSCEGQKPDLYYVIFHLLMSIQVPINNIVTFNCWDKMIVHLILAWCTYHNSQISLRVLFQLIDMINGDCPYHPQVFPSETYSNQSVDVK